MATLGWILGGFVLVVIVLELFERCVWAPRRRLRLEQERRDDRFAIICRHAGREVTAKIANSSVSDEELRSLMGLAYLGPVATMFAAFLELDHSTSIEARRAFLYGIGHILYSRHGTFNGTPPWEIPGGELLLQAEVSGLVLIVVERFPEGVPKNIPLVDFAGKGTG